MRVRAVVEFDINSVNWLDTKISTVMDELKYTLEDEHHGITEYDSCIVIDVKEIK